MTGEAVHQSLARLAETAVQAQQSENTRRVYMSALQDFLAWWQLARPELGRDCALNYRTYLQSRELGPSRINQCLCAVRHLAKEAHIRGLIDDTTYNGMASVKLVRVRGAATGKWLTMEETNKLLSQPDDLHPQLVAARDTAIIACMVGAGLRREEVAGLNVEQLERRDDRWVASNVRNKGRIRTVPLPDAVYTAIKRWLDDAEITEGRVFRRVFAHGKVGERLSGNGVWRIARSYGERPHDLRRTFAALALRGGADIKKIRDAMGHASLRTTDIYLERVADLKQAACDAIPLKLPA